MARGFDYYDALGITRNATDIDIKRAYRKLSLKYHPDTDPTEAAKQEFWKVAEAYDVLSDPKQKGLYDLYGEDGLKHGIPDGKGGVRGGNYQFDPETSPPEVFQRFFGTNNPFEALNVIAAQFEALTTKDKPRTGKQREHDVELTLEEVYHGCSKKVTHIRKILHESGRIQEEERTLVIDAKPGLPEGTRFVFEGEGNRTPTKNPGTVVFVLKTKAHDRFSRKGSDLIHKVVLPVYQSLVGTSVTVQTLDGRNLVVPLTEIVTPGYRLTVPSEGLPKPTGGKGNLIIEIELLFPTSISETQRMLLKSAFFLPSSLTPEQSKAIKTFETAFKDQVHGWATGFVKEEGSQH